MEKLDLDELAADPRKLAQVFSREMVTLAHCTRQLPSGDERTNEQMDRCLLLAGMACGQMLAAVERDE